VHFQVLEDMLNFVCFIPMGFFVVLDGVLHLFYVLGVVLDALTELRVGFLAEL
jgi:hypothetical protein